MIQQLHNRLEVNDPWAFGDIGIRYFHGEGVVQDKSKAFEYFCRGAELGSADALNAVGNAYLKGNGVAKDEKKALYYEELAAMQGNNEARHNLGIDEANAGKYDRALKHWLISCGCGYGESLKGITNLFLENLASNEDYDKALKSYKNYIEEIKSDQRDEAAAFNEQFKYIEDS
jgi:TPR repeat protein